MVITVGVDYGADTRKAMALMAEAARENPRVLKDPPPLIAFEGFGDNALTLSPALLPGGHGGAAGGHHRAAPGGLRQAQAPPGSASPIPQRDVHLTTDRPLDIRIQSAPDGGPGAQALT